MRLSNIISLFFIFLILGLCFVSQITICSANDPLISHEARRSLRTLKDPNPGVNKAHGSSWRSTNQANSMRKAYDAVNYEDAETVYDIDYQGVKTHPSPNPKHP